MADIQNGSEQIKKAKAYALRLFKLRPRSTAELIDKLRGKAYETEVIECVVNDLKAGYLDDQTFAKAWMQGRLKRYGLRRISIELTRKGISKDLISSVWNDAKQDFDEESTVRAIAQRRWNVYQSVEYLKRKKRVSDYLTRRGFSPDVISKVIREL
jgi:regulatory protein